MSTVIGEEELRHFVSEGKIIQNGDAAAAEGIKYDFHLGTRFLKAGFNSEKTYQELADRDVAIVEPGEVVFVMTEERLNIPYDIYIQLNIKRKLSHDGINLLGGTNIDPGYHGYLVFGIHNVAGSTFKLKPGRKLVGATFYRLNGTEIVENPSHVPDAIETFPDELIDLIEKYRPINPQVINQRLNELQSRIETDQRNLLQKLSSVDERVEALDEKMTDKFIDLNGKVASVEESIKSVDKSLTTIKILGKIIAWVFGVAATIGVGIATGFFNKLLGIS